MGGTANIGDIMGNIIGNTTMLIDAALTNEVRQKVAAMARKKGGAHYMARIPKEQRKVITPTWSVKKGLIDAFGLKIDRATEEAIRKGDEADVDIIERAGEQLETVTEIVTELLDDLGGVLAVTEHIPPKGNNVIAVLYQGEPTYFEVIDPELMMSLSFLNRPARNTIVSWIALPKRLGQASITLTLDFMMANMLRDTLMGSIMSRYGFKPFVDTARGLTSRLTKDQNYKDFIANGGGFSSYFHDAEAYKTHLKRFNARRGIAQSVLDTPAKFLFMIEYLADATEMSTRLGEYAKAIEAGVHPRQAAYAGREVSTDFAMRGDLQWLGFFFDTVIFLKAALNGVDRLYRGLSQDPNKKKIAAKVAALTAVSVGLYLINRGNPLYDDLEDYDKDTAWHFIVPLLPELAAGVPDDLIREHDGKQYIHFRYPKIWEIGALASLAERVVGRFLDEQPLELVEDTQRILLDTFRMEYLPQAIAPLIEVYGLNKNRFTGRPIRPPGVAGKYPYLQTTTSTSQTLARLAKKTYKLPKAFQLSPVNAEALLRGYFNTWGMYGLMMSDALIFDETPDLRWDQYPVVRRLFKGKTQGHSRHVTELYGVLKETSMARQSLVSLRGENEPEIEQHIALSRPNLEHDSFVHAAKWMSEIRKNVQNIHKLKSLEATQAYAEDLAKNHDFAGRVGVIYRSKDWKSTGALKQKLLSLWAKEKTDFAKIRMEQYHAAD
jgi:hypothetical protein